MLQFLGRIFGKDKKLCEGDSLHYYAPYYNPLLMPDGTEPEIYNRAGERLRTFFLRDIHTAHGKSMVSNYFLWDRFNVGLNTHFYSHGAMLETMGKPTKRYGIFPESRSIVPRDYQIFQKNSGLEKDFDLIFTYDEELLATLPNARFVPLVAQPCLLGIAESEFFSEQNLQLSKSNNVMMVASAKRLCGLHDLRIQVAETVRDSKLGDTFGSFDGGNYVDNLYGLLKKYRYAIMLENDITSYFFSERLINCFLTMTVPIYLGATKLHEFFNTDGIIQITPKDAQNIAAVLKQCSEQDYESRLSAILYNHEEAKKYINVYDYLYCRYIKEN